MSRFVKSTRCKARCAPFVERLPASRCRALNVLLLATGLASAGRELGAQNIGCKSPGGQTFAGTIPSNASLTALGELKFLVGMYIVPNAGLFTGTAYGLNLKPQAAYVACDPTADAFIDAFERITPSSNPNVSGGATAGELGGSSTGGRPSGLGGLTANVIVVGYIDQGSNTLFHAFRYTQSTGITDLGTLDAANNATRISMATGMSNDGSVIVGFSQIKSGGIHAFRWTAAGMVDLDAPAGAAHDSRAVAVNGDGTVIVGDGVFADSSAFTGFRNGAFRWTSAGGFQDLGALEPGFPSVATDVSADGSVVVGQGGVQIVVGGSSINGSRAFRWTSAGGIVTIGPLPGHTHAVATGVSDNGNVIVGISSAGILGYSTVGGYGTGTAFRWTQAGGIQDLRQLLVNAGVNLAGVSLVAATGVSADGQWIIGDLVTPTTPRNETRPFLLKFCDAAISGPCTPFTNPATASYSLSNTSSSVNVVAGGSVTSTLTVTPSGGFNQAVTFTCSGLPANSNCTFSPATLTPGDAAASTTLTITTTAPTRTAGLFGFPSSGQNAWAFALALLLLLGAKLAMRVEQIRPRCTRRALVTFGVLALIASCGGGDDGMIPLTGCTPAGTFPVTVTASSGSGAAAVSKTATITLTVTR